MLNHVQEDADEHMLRLGNEQMSEADSPHAHALALLMALLDHFWMTMEAQISWQ